MLRKRETQSYEEIDTVIGKDTVFTGKITAQGSVRIDGGLQGDIITKGDIVVGETGRIEGNLHARNILIAGELKGNVVASGKLELANTARIIGDLKVSSLVIDDGAVFQGTCQMDKPGKSATTKQDMKLEQT